MTAATDNLPHVYGNSYHEVNQSKQATRDLFLSECTSRHIFSFLDPQETGELTSHEVAKVDFRSIPEGVRWTVFREVFNPFFSRFSAIVSLPIDTLNFVLHYLTESCWVETVNRLRLEQQDEKLLSLKYSEFSTSSRIIEAAFNVYEPEATIRVLKKATEENLKEIIPLFKNNLSLHSWIKRNQDRFPGTPFLIAFV